MEDLQTAVKYILVKGLDETVINESLEIIPFYAINSKTLFVLHQQIGEDNYSLVAEVDTLPKLVKMSTKELFADFEKKRWLTNHDMTKVMKDHLALTTYNDPYINYHNCFSRVVNHFGGNDSWVNVMHVKGLKVQRSIDDTRNEASVWFGHQVELYVPRIFWRVREKFLTDLHLFQIYHLTFHLFLKGEGFFVDYREVVQRIEYQAECLGGEWTYGLEIRDVGALFDQVVYRKVMQFLMNENNEMSKSEVVGIIEDTINSVRRK